MLTSMLLTGLERDLPPNLLSSSQISMKSSSTSSFSFPFLDFDFIGGSRRVKISESQPLVEKTFKTQKGKNIMRALK